MPSEPAALGEARRQRAELTFKGNPRDGRHGWVRLTPAYSIHLVGEILSECGPSESVLDPFSGTGTTSLVSASLGIPAHAVDVNPFLVWLGNLKLTGFVETDRDALLAGVEDVGRRMRGSWGRRRAWVPPLHRIERWWDSVTLDLLSELFEEVGRKFPGGSPARDLARIAFCRVMIQLSRAAFNHPSMSFKKEPEGPTPGRSSRAMREHVVAAFESAARAVSRALDSDVPKARAEVFRGDARELEACLPARGYTRVVTSPPYPNRMSYIRELRPYMYWLDFLSDGRQAGELDWEAIGGTWGAATSNLSSWKPDPAQPIAYPGLHAIVRRVAASHLLLGRYLHKYFEDMTRHVRSLRRVVGASATCHYVVGNSKFYDTMVPVEEIFCALFEAEGFEDLTVTRIRKRNSKKELFEFLVTARAPR